MQSIFYSFAKIFLFLSILFFATDAESVEIELNEEIRPAVFSDNQYLKNYIQSLFIIFSTYSNKSIDIDDFDESANVLFLIYDEVTKDRSIYIDAVPKNRRDYIKELNGRNISDPKCNISKFEDGLILILMDLGIVNNRKEQIDCVAFSIALIHGVDVLEKNISRSDHVIIYSLDYFSKDGFD